MDNPYNCLYCIVMAVWSTIFVEVWKRRESEIAHMWNMENFDIDKLQEERSTFKADLIIDSRLKGSKKTGLSNSYLRRLMTELPAGFFGILAIVGCFIGYKKYSD